jgi:hypothetical protein
MGSGVQALEAEGAGAATDAAGYSYPAALLLLLAGCCCSKPVLPAAVCGSQADVAACFVSPHFAPAGEAAQRVAAIWAGRIPSPIRPPQGQGPPGPLTMGPGRPC